MESGASYGGGGYAGETLYRLKLLKRKTDLDGDFVKGIKENSERYKQFRRETDLYTDKTNLIMDLLAKNMSDEVTEEVTKQFLTAQDEFVERIFVNEFDF